MSGDPPFRAFDFRKLRNDAASVPRPLIQWQERLCVLAAEAWNKHLASPIKWMCGRSDVSPFSAATAKAPDPGIGVVMTVGDAPFPTLWALSQPHALALIADVLGNMEADWPQPRALTAIEESLLQLLMGELAWAVGEAWPGRQSIACQAGDFERRVTRSRMFGPTDRMIVSQFVIATRLGDAACQWLLPLNPFEHLAGVEWPQSTEGDVPATPSPGLERLAVTLPITMTACLGTASLPMSQLADLHVGDVIVLEQFISEPVTATVHGSPKYRGFPGRIGMQRSFQIVDVLESIVDERSERSV